MITAQTAKYQLGRLHDASYGSMISVSSLLKISLMIIVNYLLKFLLFHKNGLHIQPCGQYLRAFHKGDWSKILTL